MKTMNLFARARVLFFGILALAACGCSAFYNGVTVSDDNPAQKLAGYKYFHTMTPEFAQRHVYVHGDKNVEVNATDTREGRAYDILTGGMMKRGFINIPDMARENLPRKTLLITCAESGGREKVFTYQVEITLQFLDAETNELLLTCTCRGEGAPRNEAIRRALQNGMKTIFKEK